MKLINNYLKKNNIIIRNFQLSSWEDIFNKMTYFTNFRNENTLDEIWFVEHYPIYTQGQFEYNSLKKNINNIPILYTNRGGKITYHGPGQQVVYLLLNLKRLKINIRQLLSIINNVVLNTLYYFSIIGNTGIIPGIYVEKKKICSIGLRIKKYFTLHGFSLNIKMNLEPFKYIHPCGDSTIIMTHMYDINKHISLEIVRKILIKNFFIFLT
ncbi:lipoyl(octanoyl) transferase LipB [Buchnera aphidicola]|uniref:Octanoyltransferase n=1 Tax=Buchnera aphidicola (Therioaphis trifolii) TaxID=1241884 RepID=A0A4D6YDP7_9GAMM|nr:lipoyl(octanoyl) transferase [Buchnera aphidicola (Therioaphis trifolii)]